MQSLALPHESVTPRHTRQFHSLIKGLDEVISWADLRIPLHPLCNGLPKAILSLTELREQKVSCSILETCERSAARSSHAHLRHLQGFDGVVVRPINTFHSEGLPRGLTYNSKVCPGYFERKS